MGKFLNGRWWVGNLMLFEALAKMGNLILLEALASRAFDHLKCQHTREFDFFFPKKSHARRCAQGNRGYGQFLELTGTLY